VVSAPRRAPRTPSLVGADPGEPQSAPPRTRDVPWSPGEGPSSEQPTLRPQSGTLDPELAPAGSAELFAALPKEEEGEAPQAQSAVWGHDSLPATPAPFTNSEPGPGHEVPEWDMPAAPAPAVAAATVDEKGESGLGETLDPPVPPPEAPAESASLDHDPAAAAEPFPGDEPTRVEGVSAALIDRLRERDEEPRPQMQQGPEGNVAVQDFTMPAVEDSDPDQSHWRETYDQFCELKLQLGEPADRISFERFAAKLRKNRTELVAKHNCKGVRFSVYEKDGKAAIKASAIR
jgi:hypothetical protein